MVGLAAWRRWWLIAKADELLDGGAAGMVGKDVLFTRRRPLHHGWKAANITANYTRANHIDILGSFIFNKFTNDDNSEK